MQQGWEIFEGLGYVPSMDEIIEVLRLKPVRFGIVDHKFDIWRHPDWLYRTQIDTQNLRGGILVAHYAVLPLASAHFLTSANPPLISRSLKEWKRTLYTPNPRPSSQINHIMQLFLRTLPRIFPHRRKMQPPSAQIDDHSVLHILSFLLALIIWKRISAFSELVVATPVFECIVARCGRYGYGSGGLSIDVTAIVGEIRRGGR